jgi:Cdc6-like AAA superfamily ATPase
MGNFKINSLHDTRNFIPTAAYQNLLTNFKKLQEGHGIILHVLGAPGTGKSTNIYQAVEELDLNVFSVKIALDEIDTSPKNVFNLMISSMKDDLAAHNNQELNKRLKEFDAIIFADEFHDSHLLTEDKFGFSQWTEYYGWKSILFYVCCVKEYIKNRNFFKEINIILQTAWRIKIFGKKKDLFTDFGFFSRILRILLRIPFKVVVISYTTQETVNIVNQHIEEADSQKIKDLIAIYGCKPRIICEYLK